MAILALTADPSALGALALELGEELVVETRLGEGLARVREACWSVVLLDEDFADRSALDLIERFEPAKVAVALLARAPSLLLTLEAIQRGARDVLSFPPEAAKVRELAARYGRREGTGGWAVGLDEAASIIGRSPAMLSAFKTVARVAGSTATVLIRGESGTGKELLAHVVHQHSARSRGPFVAVNCAALPEHLLESELFGHEKGSFTGAISRRIGRFERATAGTLFLDEIGDMSLALQAKILRALQEREIERVGGEQSIPVDVRVIAATNQDLEADVAIGRFREDLYYRLAVVVIRLPPLRERSDDIRLLVEHFVARFAREYGRAVRAVSHEALAVIRAHPWPGNIRQLKNALEHAVLLADGEVLLPAHLPPEIREPGSVGGEESQAATPLLPLDEIESRHIRRALAATGGHLARTAEILGIHRNTLRRKLEAYGLG